MTMQHSSEKFAALAPLMSIDGVQKRFGGVTALRDVSFGLMAGQIVGLIGPNGAGKTTLVNIITGVERPDGGAIVFQGRRIDRMSPYRITRLGVGRTFQIVHPFPRMSVLENVAAAAMFGAGCRTITAAKERAAECLEFTGLSPLAATLAEHITLPDRKRLELAKGLATDPKLLLLDEVNAGLTAIEIDRALELIQAIAARGITILLIEHLMRMVLRACSRILVLHQGALIADGAPHAVIADQKVIDAYLGPGFNRGPVVD